MRKLVVVALSLLSFLLAATSCRHDLRDPPCDGPTRHEQDAPTARSNTNEVSAQRRPVPGLVELQAPGVFSIALESRFLPIIKCELDNDLSRIALIDTGSTANMIAAHYAMNPRFRQHSLDLIRIQRPTSVLAFTSCVSAPWALIGLLRVNRPDFLPTDLPVRLDCVIGNGVISQVAMLMDSGSGKVTFGESERVRALMRDRYSSRTWSTIELEFISGGWVTTMNSRIGALRLMIDTGSTVSMISRSLLDKIPVNTRSWHRTQMESTNSDEEGDVELCTVNDLRVGKWLIDVNMRCFDSPLFSDADGVIGFDILGKFPWMIDDASSELLIADPDNIARLEVRIDEDDDLRRMCADTYPPFKILALQSIARLADVDKLRLAGELLGDERTEIRESAAYAIMKTIGEDWSSSELISSAIRWWREHSAELK